MADRHWQMHVARMMRSSLPAFVASASAASRCRRRRVATDCALPDAPQRALGHQGHQRRQRALVGSRLQGGQVRMMDGRYPSRR